MLCLKDPGHYMSRGQSACIHLTSRPKSIYGMRAQWTGQPMLDDVAFQTAGSYRVSVTTGVLVCWSKQIPFRLNKPKYNHEISPWPINNSPRHAVKCGQCAKDTLDLPVLSEFPHTGAGRVVGCNVKISLGGRGNNWTLVGRVHIVTTVSSTRNDVGGR